MGHIGRTSVFSKILEHLRRRNSLRFRPLATTESWRATAIHAEFTASKKDAENARSDLRAIGRANMPLEVLLVDDNPGDVRLVQEAFREACDTIHLHVAVDGVDALTFLRQEGEHANAPRPDFILLDLDMPRTTGREVLTVIKRDAGLKTIPTAILTGSDDDMDVETSYSLQANCYLRKPLNLIDFKILVKAINQFWMTMVTLPPRPEPTRAFQNFDEARQTPRPAL
jgi:chemotaxis family two-component system response regulator Rcp1